MLFASSLRKELGRSFGATLVVLVTIVMTVMLIRTLGQATIGRVDPSEVLLVMGFTGKAALEWKLKYIAAFNAMEKQLAAQHKEQRAVQDANIQNAIDRVIEARKKLDENTAFLDECRKNREDSKAKYMQVKALCGEFKAIYGQHCDTVRTMENVVRGSQSFLTSAIDNLTIVSKGYPFYAALMDSLLDGLPAEKKEE